MALPKFLSFFGDAEPPKAPVPVKRARTTASEKAIQSIDPVSDRIARLASHGTPFLGGMVQLLDPALADAVAVELVAKIANVLNIELARYFPRGEVFHHLGGLCYALIFPQLDLDAASRRLRSCTIFLSEAVKKHSAELSDRVTEVFHLAHFDAQAVPLKPGIPSVTMFEQLDTLRSAAVQQVAVDRLDKLRRSDVLFYPAWNARKLMTTFNRAILDMAPVRQTTFYALGGTDEEGVAQIEIDLVLIKKSLLALSRQPKTQKFPLILVTIGFATLRDEDAATAYCQFLESIPKQYRPSLILEIVDIPPELEAEELAAKVALLNRYIRLIVVEAGIDHPLLTSLEDLNVWAVSIGLSNVRSTDPVMAAKLGRLAAAAVEAKVNAIAHDVASPGLALMLANAGIGFIDEPGLQDAVKLPILPTKVTMPSRI